MSKSSQKAPTPSTTPLAGSPAPQAARSTPHSALPIPHSASADPDPILLAVVGMSPAVLTETIWALATEPEPVIPRRIIVLTTTEGRRRVAEQLFSPCPSLGGRTPWEALRSALAAAGHDLAGRLQFGTTADDLRVITALEPGAGRSVELADIRSPSDNEAAADYLLEQVRQVVENPDTQLIASVAGGRKTMGALLYACLTLAARETDRLTHVLVNEPFDTIPGFFFPAQPGGPVAARDGTRHDPASARIELADVPFVPLRNLFVRELGRKAGTFSRLVDSCREQVRSVAGENLRLTLCQSRPELDVEGFATRLAPREHLVLLFLATRAKEGAPPLASQKDAEAPLNEFRSSLVADAPRDNFADWRVQDSLRNPLDEVDIRRALSSLRTKLRAAGPHGTRLAACLPEKGRFALAVPGSLIHLKP